MNFRTVIICTFLIGIYSCNPVIAQTETDQVVEDIIESVTEDAGEDFDYSELVERLNYYYKNPINLNKALPEQLHELFFLSPLQINALLQYREKNGAFIDLLELQSIENFDLETINRLLPFVTLTALNPLADLSSKKLLNKGVHDIMFRYGQVLEKQEGFLIPDTGVKSRYLGSPQRLFIRYRYNYGQHVFASLNMKKDAGEGFFSGTQPAGFDFYSANLFFRNTGKFRKIAIGDYALQFGQGLTLWTGLGFGKGAAITTMTKPDIGLRPYSSTNEALFFRGLATTIDIKKLSFTPFISYHSLDAGLSTPVSPTDQEEITSLSQAGFHRTQNEIKNKNTVRQLIYGMNVQYNTRNFNAGVIGYQTNFNHSFESGKDLYNKFDFSGRSLLNTGLYYNRNWHNMYLFGELARSSNNGFAYLNGLMASLSPQVSIVMMHRNYQKNYQSFYSEAVSEGTKAANEKGFYSGLIIIPDRKIELSVYADFFRFPWLKFRVDAPSKGYEVFSQFNYTVKKKIKAIFRYKLEEKEENEDSKNAISPLAAVQKQNYRAELNYTINDNFQLRNRLEIVRYKKGEQKPEFGYLLFQDLIYNPMQSPLSGNMRFAIFDTPGYNSRVYAYENDVLYSYSVPALQNSGLRFYVNGRYTVKRGIDLWLKYSITKYTNVDEIGSGLDMIEGSIKSDVKIQLRFQL